MASDWGQNRYSDFVALGTLLRFENCSSSHRTVVFVASVPCLRVVASLVSSYCCLRGVGSMSSSRRIPRFIVPYSSSFLCLRVVGSSFRRLRYILDSGIEVNFSRLCWTPLLHKGLHKASLQGRIRLVFTIVG